MINVNDFKNGQTINYDGNLYQVLDFNHVKPGKGAAIVKAKKPKNWFNRRIYI